MLGLFLLFTRISALLYDFHVFTGMSTYFWCRLLHFHAMSIWCVLWMNGSEILLWVRTWHILFSTIVRRSYVESPGSLWLYFGHISFGTSAVHSYIEPPGSWWLEFGTPGLRLRLGQVSTFWGSYCIFILVFLNPVWIFVPSL